MKSILFMSLIAASLTIGCNNAGPSSEIKDDTTAKSSDTGNHSDASNHGESGNTELAQHAEARFSGTTADTTVEGTARFDVSNGKVKLVLDITVPKKAGSSVAIHFHEHGDCGNKAEMAHGHWNPTKKEHGKWGEGNFHAGDIGNISLDKDGKATFTVETDLWTIGGDSTTNILGRSLIVHSGKDDYKTQPSGNSGSRIGCAVIGKQ